MYRIVCEKGKCTHPKALPRTRYVNRPWSALVPPGGREDMNPQPRRPIMDFVLQRPSPNFHMPNAVLAKIVSYVAEEGIEELKNWIMSGPEGAAAVLSRETLYAVRLDKSDDFIQWSRPASIHYRFYKKCLENKNPYAIYVESILLAFRRLDLQAAIHTVEAVKDELPVAMLLYIMLNSCAGTEKHELYRKFKEKYPRFNDVDKMADALLYHINEVNPKRKGTYERTWRFEDFPECWQYHQYLKESNGERCMECIYFYLSRDICLLS